MIKFYYKIKERYNLGNRLLLNPINIEAQFKNQKEIAKRPLRHEVINYLLSLFSESITNYLEIGVRNPNDNFNKIIANEKYSVDPGIEYKENPVDFKITSDDFFNQLNTGEILN